MRLSSPLLRALRLSLAASLALGLGTGTAAVATPSGSDGQGPAPTSLALPDGFAPEGIAAAQGRAWFGSRESGDIYRLDLRSGRGTVISEGPGSPSLGLDLDRRGRLFVAGGTAGDARVVDARSGEVLADYTLVEEGASFINDVIVTKRAAWFTDSVNAHLFKVPLSRRGDPAPQRRVRRVELGGDWVQSDGLSANGITTTPDGRALLVVNTTSGDLFRVSQRSGEAEVVDLGGADLASGDGLLREGRTLFAVQNRLEQVAVVELARDARSGRLAATFSAPSFDIPTTIARSGGSLYLPNARFSTEVTPETPYSVTRVPRPRG